MKKLTEEEKIERKKEAQKKWREKNNQKIKDYNDEKKDIIKEKKKNYYQLNKEKYRETQKNYYQNNKEKFLKYKEKQKTYYKDSYKEKFKETKENYYQLNKERIKENAKNYYQLNKEAKKEYRKNNKDSINKKLKDKRDNDPLYKLKINIRIAISNSIKNNGYQKESRTFEILGCSYEHFKEYIESFFVEERAWMNWDNYGNPKDGIFEPNKSWDIDHIIPSSSYNNEQELLELNHYTNLQPLCSYYNRFIKRNNLENKS